MDGCRVDSRETRVRSRREGVNPVPATPVPPVGAEGEGVNPTPATPAPPDQPSEWGDGRTRRCREVGRSLVPT